MTIDSSTRYRPKLGEEGERCTGCGVPLAEDQRYCLNCGGRRGNARVPFMDVLHEQWDAERSREKGVEQPGRGKDQRPGADRPDHRHRVGGLAQEVADDLVAHGLDGRRTAAGDEHDLWVGDVAEGAVGDHLERSVGGHGLEPLGHHHWPVLVVEPPQAGKDL